MKDGDLDQRLLVAALRLLLGLVDPLLHGLEVGQDQLGRDDLDVSDRVDRAHGMDAVGVLEAAHDAHDRIHLADRRKERVAEALPLARAGDETRDVHEFNRRGNGHVYLRYLSEDLQAVRSEEHTSELQSPMY